MSPPRTVRIDHAAKPFYIRREGDVLCAVLLDSPWSAPAAWIETIDLAEPDLAALNLLLYLAYPTPRDGKKRALEARKVLAHWRANATGRIDSEFRFDRESRIGAMNRVWKRARKTVERVQIWTANSFLISVQSDDRGDRLRIASIDGPSGVTHVARAVAGREKRASHKTVLRDYWRGPAPVWCLAEAVFQTGGVDALIAAGCDGDAASIRRVLDEAEKNRRLGLHTPNFEIVVETIEKSQPGEDADGRPRVRPGPAIQFRPADAE